MKESYPDGLGCKDVAVLLSRKKAEAYGVIDDLTLLIACDTLVCLKGKILGKPACYDDAVEMLVQLSGNMHEVITAVTLRSSNKIKSFYVSSKVYFKSLKIDDIEEYVRSWKPYDKAGGYGIQECYSEKGDMLSPVAIEKIEGSYSNVVGLPLEELKVQLQLFTDKYFKDISPQ